MSGLHVSTIQSAESCCRYLSDVYTKFFPHYYYFLNCQYFIEVQQQKNQSPIKPSQFIRFDKKRVPNVHSNETQIPTSYQKFFFYLNMFIATKPSLKTFLSREIFLFNLSLIGHPIFFSFVFIRVFEHCSIFIQKQLKVKFKVKKEEKKNLDKFGCVLLFT